MEENSLNNNELPKEIQADDDNTNPLLDIIATLQEKLNNSSNQNISNNVTNTSTTTYSNNNVNNFSQNMNTQNVNNQNMNYNYGQNQNNNNGNNSNNGFDISKIFELLNGFSGSSQQSATSTASTSNPFMNIDMDTMMRVGKIFSSMNKEDPRKNLLLSLKPFLRDNRQRNVDTYIFILGILNVLDSFSNGDSGY